MKLNQLLMAAAVSSVLVSAGASAVSDNTVTFIGEVADQTCDVTINGVSAAPVVLMPTAAAADLATNGSTTGVTTFDLGLSGCTAATEATNISVRFLGNNVTGTGHLGNTGTAQNVEIQLLDPSDNAIDLTGGYTGSNALSLAVGDTSASATYSAQYYATGVATVGTVQGSMQYAVTYP